jgi:Xaa-Pro aminopeptidase
MLGTGPAARSAVGLHRFRELVRDDDPTAMTVAEDALLEGGAKMREATGGLRARNFTIEMNPMFWPGARWKMVQVSVEALTSKPGTIWTRWVASNGPVRVQREQKHKGEIDESKQTAVATAWAIAKAIKPLPLDASQKEIEAIVDRAIRRRKSNARPAELF